MSVKPVLVVTGASGPIGRHLLTAASNRYTLRVLTHSSTAHFGQDVAATLWNPVAAVAGDAAERLRISHVLDGATAVVNLAGAPTTAGRLGRAHRGRVVASRVESAQALLHACRYAEQPPRVWVQASATGYYGDAGETVVTEASPKDETLFFADVCEHWEAAAADAGGARLVLARIGIVLARDAPGWKNFLQTVRFRVGVYGDGRQWWSWIDADDLAHALLFLVENEASRGVYNLTAPAPVRQGELARKVAARLGIARLVATPAPLLRLATGGLADNVLLPSAKVLPLRLQREGFSFRYPDVESELAKLLAQP